LLLWIEPIVQCCRKERRYRTFMMVIAAGEIEEPFVLVTNWSKFPMDFLLDLSFSETHCRCFGVPSFLARLFCHGSWQALSKAASPSLSLYVPFHLETILRNARRKRAIAAMSHSPAGSLPGSAQNLSAPRYCSPYVKIPARDAKK
jgi:hypothetical protein